MFRRKSGGGLVGRPRRRAVPSRPCEGLQVPAANDPGLSDELGEYRVDQAFVPGEPTSILRRPGRLPEAAAVVELEAQEVSEQHGTVRVGRPAEELLDQRAAARAPGGLEPVARLVHIARDSGRIEPVISPCCVRPRRSPRSERRRSNVQETPSAIQPWRVAALNG